MLRRCCVELWGDMTEYVYRTRQGDVLDKLCAVFYRRDDMLEAVYERNPHLFALGCRLPVGTEIIFPPAPKVEASARVVGGGGLWGGQ